MRVRVWQGVYGAPCLEHAAAVSKPHVSTTVLFPVERCLGAFGGHAHDRRYRLAARNVCEIESSAAQFIPYSFSVCEASGIQGRSRA